MLKRLSLALCAAMPLFAAAPAHSQNTIADIVVRASGGATAGTFDRNWLDYDILLNALTTANLVGAVADPNASLTVFAPSDFAFFLLARDLGYTGTSEEGTWNFLVAALTQLGNGNPVPILTNVLLYHVAPGVVGPIDLFVKTLRRENIDTLLAGATIRPLFLQLIDNDPQLRNPFVTAPLNLRASNGVIHGVTRVLIPVDLP
jgi:uncharacterized surface protein with fasciclin (FAS1) repeats